MAPRPVVRGAGRALAVAGLMAAIVGAAGCRYSKDEPVTWELYRYTGPDKACNCPEDKKEMFQGAGSATVFWGYDRQVTGPESVVMPWKVKASVPSSAFAAVLRATASDPKDKLVGIIREGDLVINWCAGTGSLDCTADLSRS